MNPFIKSALLSLVVMHSGIIAAYQPVVEDAEYKRAAEQMKKANAKVEELYDALVKIEQELVEAFLESKRDIKFIGLQKYARAHFYRLQEGHEALLQKLDTQN